MKRFLSLLITLTMICLSIVNPAFSCLEDTSQIGNPDTNETHEIIGYKTVLHNILQKYSQLETLIDDDNMLWFIPDIMAYSQLYPDSENIISDEGKQILSSKIIKEVKESTSASTLAKSIIALRSMGYDARNIVTSELDKIDIVSRLVGLWEQKDEGATLIWTLPYVLIALEQGEDYITSEQKKDIVKMLVDKKEEWQDMSWGPDGASPVIYALSPYYEVPEVKEVIDETLPLIINQQDDTGIILNAASTGLVIMALSGICVDSEQIVKNSNSLIDGLMTKSTQTLDGFEPIYNSFSTEQGLRGLLAWEFLKSDLGKRVYDFKSNPLNIAYETKKESCEVIFNVEPQDAVLVIENVSGNDDFNLPKGVYNYSVTKSGYNTLSGSFEITDDDIKNGTKNISLSMERKSSSGSGSKKIHVSVKVMVHGDDCNGSYTYKNDSDEFYELVSCKVSITKGDSVYDALLKALESKNINFTESDGYVSKIGDYKEFDHGKNSGWMFSVNSKHKNTSCRDTILKKDSTVLWYYTDDYKKEQDSTIKDTSSAVGENQKFGLPGKNKDIKYKEVIHKGKTFKDISDCSARKEIEALLEREIVSGKTNESYEPYSQMTRAEFATIIVNALGLTKKGENVFCDVKKDDWFFPYIMTAYHYGIIKGVSANEFNPQGTITIQEVSVMIERASSLCALKAKNTLDISQKFKDFADVSSWAFQSVEFCIKQEIIDITKDTIRPKENVTRMEVAVMIYKMLKGAKLI